MILDISPNLTHSPKPPTFSTNKHTTKHNKTMTTNTTTTTMNANIKNAPHWMESEERFRFWEKNGISDHDRSEQIRITLEEYLNVPAWQLQDAEKRFADWCSWFSDFCWRVNANA